MEEVMFELRLQEQERQPCEDPGVEYSSAEALG